MPQSTLGHDVPCAQCAYNVRGLQRDGRCPECGYPIKGSIEALGRSVAAARPPDRLTGFDRLCARLSIVLAVVLLPLGAFGLIFGCEARFSLPPVLGVLPAVFGWGILRSVLVAIRVTRDAGAGRPITGAPPAGRSATSSLSAYRDPIPVSVTDVDAEIGDGIPRPAPGEGRR